MISAKYTVMMRGGYFYLLVYVWIFYSDNLIERTGVLSVLLNTDMRSENLGKVKTTHKCPLWRSGVLQGPRPRLLGERNSAPAGRWGPGHHTPGVLAPRRRTRRPYQQPLALASPRLWARSLWAGVEAAAPASPWVGSRPPSPG